MEDYKNKYNNIKTSNINKIKSLRLENKKLSNNLENLNEFEQEKIKFE